MPAAAQQQLTHRGKGHGWGSGTGRTTPPAQRGALRIADRVLARIAWLAAREALATAAGDPPRVKVTRSQGTALVRVGVDLPFPSDLAALAATVQAAVADQVSALAGVPVREVTVVVERLLPIAGPTADRAVEG